MPRTELTSDDQGHSGEREYALNIHRTQMQRFEGELSELLSRKDFNEEYAIKVIQAMTDNNKVSEEPLLIGNSYQESTDDIPSWSCCVIV